MQPIELVTIRCRRCCRRCWRRSCGSWNALCSPTVPLPLASAVRSRACASRPQLLVDPRFAERPKAATRLRLAVSALFQPRSFERESHPILLVAGTMSWRALCRSRMAHMGPQRCCCAGSAVQYCSWSALRSILDAWSVQIEADAQLAEGSLRSWRQESPSMCARFLLCRRRGGWCDA
jgi:hypothetical protein